MTQNIHPTAVISPTAKIGDHVTIGPYCVVGDKVTLHDHVTLKSHVVVDGWTDIGDGTTVYPFACLGQIPQTRKDESSQGIKLIIGKNNIIREYVTMQPGTLAGGLVTSVGDNGFYMAYSHIAHDCHIGNNVTMANCATLAGHVIVGDHVNIGGLAAVHQNVRIGNHAFIGGTAGIKYDVIPYAIIIPRTDSLSGLNLVGLKRSGIPREDILEMVNAYDDLFADHGTMQERTAYVGEKYKNHKHVMEIIDFITEDSKRSLSVPAA
jgi:UDP-N-acetylglucosamine acyltransferase